MVTHVCYRVISLSLKNIYLFIDVGSKATLRNLKASYHGGSVSKLGPSMRCARF